MRVAIHQPNFLPWLGYFNKISDVDKFIFLDDAQMPKKSSLLNRSYLLANDKKIWGTLPIKSYHGFLPINQVEYSREPDWRQGYLDLLSGMYSRHPHFFQVKSYFQEVMTYAEYNLQAFNRYLIQHLVETLKLRKPEFVLASSFNVHSSGTERLCELIRLAGGDTYLCGRGSKGYLNENLFSHYGLTLEYQRLRNYEYPQFRAGNFVPGLSIVDLMMNVGLSEANRYIV